MIAFFRRLSQSLLAKVLFGVLILAFMAWGGSGMRDAVTGQISNAVVQAGSRTLGGEEFKKIFENYKEQQEAQFGGQPIPTEEFVKQGVPLQLAQRIAVDLSFSSWMRSNGVVASPKLVAAEIGKIPAFRDEVSGKFDQKKFAQLLRERGGITPAQFKQQLSDEIALQHMGRGLGAGLRAPRIYSALQANYVLESRDASYIKVDAKLAGAPPKPTDAQLQQLITENAAQLRRPERRSVRIVLFNPTDEKIMKSVTLDEAEVRKAYDFKKDALSQAERRSFVQIPAPDAATAQRVSAALKAGQDVDAVAKANKLQPIDMTDKPKTAVPDPAVAEVAFGLKEGEVSGPIRGQLGFAVVKVISITAGKEVTFEEARKDIETEMRQRGAVEKVELMVQKYEDLRAKGTPLLEAAAAVGADVQTFEKVAKDGVTKDKTGKEAALPPPVVQAMFGLPKGGESDLGELGQGYYFAVRVDDVLPPSLPTVDEVRKEATAFWTDREQAKLLKAKSDEISARLAKGETLEAIAASMGAKVEKIENITRENAPQSKLPRPLLAQVFNHPRGQTFSAQIEEKSFAVGRVDAVRAPTPILAASRLDQFGPQMTMGMFQDFGELARKAAKEKVKPKVNAKRINSALGVSADVGAPAKKKQ